MLSHRPDVVTIDYAVNDTSIGLERARKAWSAMIEQAQAKGVKVILLTPTPIMGKKFDDPKVALNQHAEQIRALAREYHVGLVDSLAAFARFEQGGGQVATLMAQVNHPNQAGHKLVADALIQWFP